jgi:TetR/AcrR family tetracycline transcriptional repressor
LAFTSKTAAGLWLKRPTGKIAIGRQDTGGSNAPAIFVLPSPSGLATSYWSIEPWRELSAFLRNVCTSKQRRLALQFPSDAVVSAVTLFRRKQLAGEQGMKRQSASTGAKDVREKGSLDRATIVTTALRLLDDVGIEGLSTRRIASELGIKSASLYWHFKDKNELLNEMSGLMFQECLPAPNIDGDNFDAWNWLAEGARAIRRTALSRRDGAQVMARPRPRVVSGRARFEDNVKTLVRSGLADMEARLAMQTLRRFAIGTALQEQSNNG